MTQATNVLTASGRGRIGARAKFRVIGYLVDEVAPTLSFLSPSDGAGVQPTDPIELTFSDDQALASDTLRITLNGQDVTSLFAVTGSSATATIGDLPAGALLPGANQLVARVRDRAWNEGSAATTFLLDSQPPVFTPAPGDVTAEQTSPNGATVTFPQPTVVDAGDPNPTVVCSPASGSLFPPGSTTVTCTATDSAGNSSTATFQVVVEDTTPPELTPMADVVAEQTGPSGATVSFSAPTAIDSADPNPTVVCSPASGSLFPAGSTTVTCTATDSSGNASTTSFQVVVQDTTPPALTPTVDLVVEQAGPSGATVSFSAPTASDAVTASPAVVCSPASGSLFPAGTTTVTCTATDAAGNVGTTSFQVTVRDSTPPSLAVTPDQVVEQTSQAGALVTYVAPVASDAVTVSPGVVCTPASGTLFPPGVTTVTCVATDDAGNQGTSTFQITVQDTTPPSLTSVADFLVEQTAAAGAVVSYVAPVASDAVSSSLTVDCSPPSGSLFPSGVTTVTCTATDAAGNVGTTSFEVTVRDTTPPTISINPDLLVEQSTPAGAVVSYVAPIASDLVTASPVVTCSPPAGTVFSAGTTTVTCTATDAAGNAATSTFQVTVQDTTPPTISTLADLTLEQTSQLGAVGTFPFPGVVDAADPSPSVVCAPPSGTTFPRDKLR